MSKRLLYASLLTWMMAAVGCSSDGLDGTDEPTPVPVHDGKVTVQLNITAAGSQTSSMRASWQDDKATDDEMMNLWTVIIVNSANDEVVEIQSCSPSSVYAEIDDVTTLAPGTYRFYSFANIGATQLEDLLELPTGSVPVPVGTDAIVSNKKGDGTGGTSTDLGHIYPTGSNNIPPAGGKIVDNIVATIHGNQFSPTAANNGFGAKGIPMSNVQTYDIASSGSYDLIVVRMMAKVKLQIKNETGASVKVNSATLSNVTKNAADNLKLLPVLTQHNTMDVTHGDIQPNLGTATQEDLTVTVNQTIAVSETKEVSFYVNECGTPNNPEGLFYLTLDIDNAGTSEFRYALISNEESKWNYIARNDYRIIPITMDDLKFEIIPYDFPPIGVYPVSVKEIDATNHVYGFTFHDYGHFHLLPFVTKGGTPVAFSSTTPTGTDYQWTLIDNDWSKSWFTAATQGGVWLDAAGITSNGFYRNATATADADEAGETPVWYVNDGVAGPQWDPDASGNYRPFVFGYIADPGSSMSEDKKIYHEMKIQVYNGTTAYRQMLYRFYMILDQDQMMYSRMFGAPRVRHTHGY